MVGGGGEGGGGEGGIGGGRGGNGGGEGDVSTFAPIRHSLASLQLPEHEPTVTPDPAP